MLSAMLSDSLGYGRDCCLAYPLSLSRTPLNLDLSIQDSSHCFLLILHNNAFLSG